MSERANTTAHSEWSSLLQKSFITTKAYNGELYTYTTSRSGITEIGTLVLHASATADRCPARRVLHVTGRRLTPGVNPMTVFTSPAGTTIQSPKFMLSVYDPVSMLNGFIDPTSRTFAVYDKNRPSYDFMTDNTATTFGGQSANLLTPAVSLNITAANNAATTATADVGLSRAGALSFLVGSTDAVTTLTVTATSVTANSFVFLSSTTATPVWVSSVVAGQFVITVTAAAENRTINFVIIN
jgi:hypothetical protein